jgi:predicted nucleic acid-binding protein
VRFWDASALVPLTVGESASETVENLVAEDSELAAWWGSYVECSSAITRRERAGTMDPTEADGSRARLLRLAKSWTEVPPSDRLREAAIRLLRVHDLRADCALQLAAAIAAAEGDPATLDVVTLDERFVLAARREGFRVLPG